MIVMALPLEVALTVVDVDGDGDSTISSIHQDIIQTRIHHYQPSTIFSKVLQTETKTGWFGCMPLWIDLLDPSELIPTPLKYARKDEDWMRHLEKILGLSWILIDPTRNRAANLSSERPVSAQRHWLIGDLELVYAMVIVCDKRSPEWINYKIKVTCCGEVEGEMRVREVSLILQKAFECGKRKKAKWQR